MKQRRLASEVSRLLLKCPPQQKLFWYYDPEKVMKENFPVCVHYHWKCPCQWLHSCFVASNDVKVVQIILHLPIHQTFLPIIIYVKHTLLPKRMHNIWFSLSVWSIEMLLKISSVGTPQLPLLFFCSCKKSSKFLPWK